MGTYNGERFVREQLTSILAQSLTPWEVLVSDDGSTDTTLQIVEEVAADTDIPVRVRVNPQNLGFADNFLQAAGRASGEYVAFSDQDDRWHPDKLARQVETLTSHHALLCAHVVGQIGASGETTAAPPTGDGPRIIDPQDADPWGNFYGFTMLFRRDLMSHLPSASRGTDPHSHGTPLSHDRWIYFLASTFGRMVELDEPLADYRQHESQLYGGTRHRTIRQRVSEKLNDGLEQTLDLADIAEHRADLLRTLEDGQAATAATRWRTMATGLRRSADVYGSASPGRRAASFLRNLRSGVYGPAAHGGLGPRRMRHDLVMVAVPRGRHA